MSTKTNRILTALALVATSSLTWAHGGHGQGDGVHLHATDAWGWALALGVAAALWWARRRP